MKTVLQQSCPFPNLSALYRWGRHKRITGHSCFRQRLSENLGCTPLERVRQDGKQQGKGVRCLWLETSAVAAGRVWGRRAEGPTAQ